MKKVNRIVDFYSKLWKEQRSHESYSYVEKCIEFNDEYLRLIIDFEKANKHHHEKQMSIYALNSTVSNLYNEIIHGFLVGQRIATQSLARSIIENYITISFLGKYSDESYHVYYADSQIKKITQHSRADLTKGQLNHYRSESKKIRKSYVKYELGKGYNWTKSFIRRDPNPNENINLRKLAEDCNLLDAYSMFGMLSDATHSKDLFTHDLNNFRIKSYALYTMPVFLGMGYILEIAHLSFDSEKVTRLSELYMEVEKEYAKVNRLEVVDSKLVNK